MQADGASYRNVLLTRALGAMPVFIPIIEADSAPLPAETPRAAYPFPQDEIDQRLTQLGLSATSALSVLAVELLPFDTAPQFGRHTGVDSTGQDIQADPLGADLGTRRILRTSPLTALPSVC